MEKPKPSSMKKLCIYQSRCAPSAEEVNRMKYSCYRDNLIIVLFVGSCQTIPDDKTLHYKYNHLPAGVYVYQ